MHITTIVKINEHYSMNDVNFGITRGLHSSEGYIYQVQTFDESFTEIIHTELCGKEESMIEYLGEIVGGEFKFSE